jgi:cobalamin-dependent methionine synthase I
MCWPTAVARVLSEMLMTSSKEKAAEFRRQAAICFDIAQRISLKEDQERMMQVAEHWLELAKRAEAELINQLAVVPQRYFTSVQGNICG